MTVNRKDNIEYAAAMLFFIEHPILAQMEKESAYVHALFDFFRTSIVTFAEEIPAEKQKERFEKDFTASIGEENLDYLALSALGTLINTKGDCYQKVEMLLETPAFRMPRPELDNCIPEFTHLYARWLDWFIHRNKEAGDKYGIVAPVEMSKEQKSRWFAWADISWSHKDDEEVQGVKALFTILMSSPFGKVLRQAQQRQKQLLEIIRRN